MPVRTIQVNMEHGQMDANMVARQDLDISKQGLLVAENWAPLPQGGVRRRPRFVRQDQSFVELASRLIEWEFDEDERYLVAIGTIQITIHRILADGITTQLVHTIDMTLLWVSVTREEIRQMQYAVAYDTMILAHLNIRPVIITRTGLDSFAAVNFSFANRADSGIAQPPTFRFTPSDILMQPCDINGVPVEEIAAGTHIYMQWFGADPATGLAYNPENLEAFWAYLRYNGVPMQITTEADANDRVHVLALMDLPKTMRIYVNFDSNIESQSWLRYETVVMAEDNGEGILANWDFAAADPFIEVIVLRGQFATDDATIVGSESGVTVTKKSTPAPVRQVMAPTPWWEESCYSDYRGWPGAVTFFQQRLWMGGSFDLPGLMVASRTQDFFNFDAGRAEDTDAIQVVLSEPGAGRIRSLRASRHLHIFTSNAELYTGEELYTPITPSQISLRTASNFGSGEASPQVFGGRVYFCQRDNRMIRAHSWNDLAQQFDSIPIGFSHEDLLTNITELNVGYGHGERSAQYLYALNDNGVLVVIFEIPAANILGFWPWLTSDKILSAALIGPQLYVIKGQYIHRADYDQVSEEPSCLETFPVLLDLQEGTSRGKYMRVGHVQLDVKETTGLYVNDQRQVEKFVEETQVPQRQDGKLDFYQLGWERDPTLKVWVGGDDPATILSILQEVNV